MWRLAVALRLPLQLAAHCRCRRCHCHCRRSPSLHIAAGCIRRCCHSAWARPVEQRPQAACVQLCSGCPPDCGAEQTVLKYDYGVRGAMQGWAGPHASPMQEEGSGCLAGRAARRLRPGHCRARIETLHRRIGSPAPRGSRSSSADQAFAEARQREPGAPHHEYLPPGRRHDALAVHLRPALENPGDQKLPRWVQLLGGRTARPRPHGTPWAPSEAARAVPRTARPPKAPPRQLLPLPPPAGAAPTHLRGRLPLLLPALARRLQASR